MAGPLEQGLTVGRLCALFRVYIQLNPAKTNIEGITNYIHYRRNSINVNIELKGKLFEGIKNLYPF